MVKTPVHLDERNAAASRQMAAETARPQAGIIREAIGQVTRSLAPHRPAVVGAGCCEGAPVGRHADELVGGDPGRSVR